MRLSSRCRGRLTPSDISAFTLAATSPKNIPMSDYFRTPVSLSDFLSRAWRIANERAGGLGWFNSFPTGSSRDWETTQQLTMAIQTDLTDRSDGDPSVQLIAPTPTVNVQLIARTTHRLPCHRQPAPFGGVAAGPNKDRNVGLRARVPTRLSACGAAIYVPGLHVPVNTRQHVVKLLVGRR